MSFVPVQSLSDPPAAAGRRFALFAYGFRPFFLLCGLYAVLALAVWLTVLTGLLPYAGPWDPLRWHMHEMLFGFAGAAIGGFMLTAVPNWTGERGYSGRPLLLVFAVFLAGRLALNPAAPLPPLAAALADLAFVPALMLTVLPSLLRSGNRRNYPFLAMLGLLFTGNLLCHLDGLWPALDSWQAGIRLTIDIILIMVVMVGGRIVPSFTSSSLRRLGRAVEIAPRPRLERAAMLALVLMLAADQALPDSLVAGALAAVAAGLTLARLAGWYGWRTRGQPILAILHLGYLWVPVGLALKALSLLAAIPFAAAWVHALTLGAFGTMILAVMSRAALGHTGRDIVAAPATVLAYGLVTLAALARVFLTGLGDWAYQPALMLAGFGWLAAFTLFTLVYAPILVGPRADGRPG